MAYSDNRNFISWDLKLYSWPQINAVRILPYLSLRGLVLYQGWICMYNSSSLAATTDYLEDLLCSRIIDEAYQLYLKELFQLQVEINRYRTPHLRAKDLLGSRKYLLLGMLT